MSDVGIGAAGVLGLAEETTPGTYVAPTKFTPLRSEGVQWQQGTNWRRVIANNIVDPKSAVPGNGHVEGDVDIEVLEDVLPHLLRAARGTMTRTGTDDPNTTTVEDGPPYTYEFFPSAAAVPPSTLSITIVRNGEVFGYTGMVIGSMNFTVDNGMLVCTFSLLGREEAAQPVPTASFEETGPFGAGTYSLQIPTGAQIFDADNFSFNVEDNGEVQNRLIDRRGAAFVKYGERNAQLSIDRDFTDRTQYDNFKNLTEQSILLRAAKDADHFVEFEIPRSAMDAFDVGLGGVGDLVRASITYQAIHDATVGGGYKLTVKTDEAVTV